MGFYKEVVGSDASVKRIGVIEYPTRKNPGIGDFEFLPVFSVFDFGTIVPPVPLDNSTINLMSAFNFELLRKKGVESHYISLVNSNGEPLSVGDIRQRREFGEIPNIMRVRLVNRIKPTFANGEWDYDVYSDNGLAHVHPVEIIFRNELPEGSSVWRRVERGELRLEELTKIHFSDLPKDFKKGDRIPPGLSPLIDFSTKYEPEDRYISSKEAQRIMKLDVRRFNEIIESCLKASRIMTDYAKSRGFELLDGKVEFVTYENDDGDMIDIFGDEVCTWHSDRFVKSVLGYKISKQIFRDKLKALNPRWYDEIQRAKDLARKMGHEDFRKLMDKDIEFNLPGPEYFEAVNNLLKTATNRWVDFKAYNVFPDQNNDLVYDLEKSFEQFYSL